MCLCDRTTASLNSPKKKMSVFSLKELGFSKISGLLEQGLLKRPLIQLPKDLRVEFEFYLDRKRPPFFDNKLVIYGPAADKRLAKKWLEDLPIETSNVNLVYFSQDYAGFSSDNEIKFTDDLIKLRNNLALTAKRKGNYIQIFSLEIESWEVGESLFVSLNYSKKHRRFLNALLYYELSK